jgi:predicted amidohydrolase
MTTHAAASVRSAAPADTYRRHYDFSEPLDDLWEVLPAPGWTAEIAPGCFRLSITLERPKPADTFQRACCIDGDTVELGLVSGAAKSGVLKFGFVTGFELILAELNLTTGDLIVRTHEAHKRQPRFAGKVTAPTRSIAMKRERDVLPGLPYPGVAITILIDGQPAARVGQIDFLPEALFNFGLEGPGTVSFSHWTHTGNKRPRAEYLRIGIWQKNNKANTRESVDSLKVGVRKAAEAGIQVLITPETSLTGLRFGDPEMDDRALVQAAVREFQQAVAATKNAPYTLVGYPDWMPGREIEASDLDWIKVNRHVFVRPDGTLGPPMAKVHSCEGDHGFWHGRNYNLQRVCGVEMAMGVCHDAHYQDVWSAGVMGGARVCLHPAAGGNLRGNIPKIVDSFRSMGHGLDSFWVRVNAGGGAAIVYPMANAKVTDTILALPDDLTEKSPTYPEYSDMGDQLLHARIRVWDATGCYPLRTLRGGSRAYEAWSKLVPKVVEV